MDGDAEYWDAFDTHFTAMAREDICAQLMIYEPGRRGRSGNKPMQRTFKRVRPKRIITYDLETTNIAEGTPDVLYITAYDGKTGWKLSEPIHSQAHFLEVLEQKLFIASHQKARFVGYNANRFDVVLAAMALLQSDNWEIHPYLTKANTIRGVRIIGRGEKNGLEFELLDAMAMTGLDTVKMPLRKFLDKFAPAQLGKLNLDFSQTSFDANNAEHVAYAERDSEGLWVAVNEVNRIMRELTGNELQTTMGKAAIHYFMSQMPEGVQVWRPCEELFEILHDRAKRGGYVWISKQYRGPVWKYDLNQAYAGAMRDEDLPAGTAVQCGEHYQQGKCGVYRCTISREQKSDVPFYYKDAESGAAGFTCGREVDTWILSNEIEHLRADNWRIVITDGWFWDQSFRMSDMVSKLEQLRFTDSGGPSGALGTIVKVIGNSSYGKTLERLEGVNIVMAKTCPPGMTSRYTDQPDMPLFHEPAEIYYAPYHQPQIGCFITAHVRVKVRAVALTMPQAFLYADTDCTVFSKPAKGLEIDPRRYGMWKQESAGVQYILIGKKIYYGDDDTKHAKGLSVRDLTKSDFEKWYAGEVPTQTQLQRVSLFKMVGGAPMFKNLERHGTDTDALKTVDKRGRKFHPVGEY